jgi:N-acetylgalactosamine-N,N'-diacetylbacillosaminyl-diphospho-undecaprenol 4-alpha-N-acetylgalactosaminyltransferase
MILGGGDKKPLEELVRELNLEDSITLLGNIENPHAYLAHADIFASTARWEGMPNGLLEAMICGLPVVASDCPSGPREILAPDTPYATRLKAGQGVEYAAYGLLTPIEDPIGTAEALKSLIFDQALRAGYARKSVTRGNEFSMESLLPEYEDVVCGTIA